MSLSLKKLDHECTVNGFDGAKFNARWMLPENNLQGIALIIQGSGNVGMNGDVSSPLLGQPNGSQSAPLSLQIAEKLKSIGIASLRYNKRGVDDPSLLSLQIPSILAKDAIAIAEQARTTYPDQKFFIIGMSEGATLSVLALQEIQSDGVFLMSLGTRNFDDMVRYQFLKWPVGLYRSQLKQIESTPEQSTNDFLGWVIDHPIFSEWIPSLRSSLIPLLKMDSRDFRSIEQGILHAYETGVEQIISLLKSPPFETWYHDLKALPPTRALLSSIRTPFAFVYAGAEDGQSDPLWIKEDMTAFNTKAFLREFKGLGHCFSPMLGSIGHIKTSGQIDEKVLEQLSIDFMSLLT